MLSKGPVLAPGRSFNCFAPCLGMLVQTLDEEFWVCYKCFKVYTYNGSFRISDIKFYEIEENSDVQEESQEIEAYYASIETEIYEAR